MKAFEKFLNRYEATAGLDEYKRYSKRQPFQLSYDEFDTAAYQSTFTTEPMVRIYMPQHQFVELAGRDDHLESLQTVSDYNQQVVDMLRADERVRDSNPAVQKAYRNYLTLLELARK